LLEGIKPPEEINVIDKFNESKDLKLKNFKTINIAIVNVIYKINILDDCLSDSEILNDKKFVNDFLRLLSKISINKIIENKKYKPPIH